MSRIVDPSGHQNVAANEVVQTGALVLGGNYRALGVVRSLGRRGIPVWIVRTDEHSIATHSRYVQRTLPWSSDDAEAQVECLLGMAEKEGIRGWVVIPTDDLTAALLAIHHERLSDTFVLATPPWEQLQIAWDKRRTHELAAQIDVDQPRTWFVDDGQEPGHVQCEFPAILKPAVKAEHNRFTDDKAWLVTDRRALEAGYAEARGLVPVEHIMVQELIPGDGNAQLSYAALADRGRVVASITARRTRQRPMDFGHASTFVETIDCPEVAESSRRLIEAMDFTGLVEVEFKRDPRDGRAKLLDINGRVWGWHTLGERAGVDFTHLYWQLLRGDPPQPVQARVGVGWVRLATDLPTAVGEIARRRMSAAAYVRSLRPPLQHAMLARDDPLPALLDLPLILAVGLRRMVRELGRRGARCLRRR